MPYTSRTRVHDIRYATDNTLINKTEQQYNIIIIHKMPGCNMYINSNATYLLRISFILPL